MRAILVAAVAVIPMLSAQSHAQRTADAPVTKEYTESWMPGTRPRDPYADQKGRVWFVGQEGNYIARFDPATESFRRFTIEEGTNPHTLIVDESGIVWYAGNRNGRIGRLDPATGVARTIMTGEARDPHTMVFDGKGNIWFTSQSSNRVGRPEASAKAP